MKNLRREIHEHALKAAHEYKKSEAALISVIQQVDEFRVYLEYGYASLFEYVTKALGLSEASAYNFIAVSRKALQIPEIKKAIESGQLTVSKVRKVIPVMTVENQREWLQKAMELSPRALELEVVRVAPEDAKRERVKIVSQGIRELRIPVSLELFEKLKRVQAVEKLRSLEETLEKLVA